MGFKIKKKKVKSQAPKRSWPVLWSKVIKCTRCGRVDHNPDRNTGQFTSPCPRCENETATYVFIPDSLNKVTDKKVSQEI